MDIIRVQSEPIEVAEALAAIEDHAAGGHAVFIGTVRNSFEGQASQGILYEAYEELAEKEMARIADEMKHEFDVLHVVLIHRVGELGLGEAAVVVAVSAAHRVAAIQACQAGIDRVKERAPIWKKERFADGQTSWHHDPANSGGTPL